MRRVPLACLLLVLTAASAHAGGINLAWESCGPGLSLRRFACDTNLGQHTMVASFVPRMRLSAVYGVIGIIDLCTNGIPLPPWWRFKSADSCRPTAMSVNALPTDANCVDPWQGAAATIFQYQLGYQGWDSARIVASVFLPGGQTFAVEPGTEYFAFNVVIRNTDTAGEGPCGGCNLPACIVLNEIKLQQQAGTPGGSPAFVHPDTNYMLNWQALIPDCPFIVANANRTWGQIKSLYR